MEDHLYHRRTLGIIIGVILVNALFQLVSLFTGWMVSIDEAGTYHHGILYPVYIVIYIYFLSLSFCLIRLHIGPYF